MARTYIVKRNNNYHFRIRVPKDLRRTLGSWEIRRSLRTNDIRVARKLARDLKAKVESESVQLRHQQLLAFEIARGGDCLAPIIHDGYRI